MRGHRHVGHLGAQELGHVHEAHEPGPLLALCHADAGNRRRQPAHPRHLRRECGERTGRPGRTIDGVAIQVVAARGSARHVLARHRVDGGTQHGGGGKLLQHCPRVRRDVVLDEPPPAGGLVHVELVFEPADRAPRVDHEWRGREPGGLLGLRVVANQGITTHGVEVPHPVGGDARRARHRRGPRGPRPGRDVVHGDGVDHGGEHVVDPAVEQRRAAVVVGRDRRRRQLLPRVAARVVAVEPAAALFLAVDDAVLRVLDHARDRRETGSERLVHGLVHARQRGILDGRARTTIASGTHAASRDGQRRTHLDPGVQCALAVVGDGQRAGALGRFRQRQLEGRGLDAHAGSRHARPRKPHDAARRVWIVAGDRQRAGHRAWDVRGELDGDHDGTAGRDRVRRGRDAELRPVHLRGTQHQDGRAAVDDAQQHGPAPAGQRDSEVQRVHRPGVAQRQQVTVHTAERVHVRRVLHRGHDAAVLHPAGEGGGVDGNDRRERGAVHAGAAQPRDRRTLDVEHGSLRGVAEVTFDHQLEPDPARGRNARMELERGRRMIHRERALEPDSYRLPRQSQVRRAGHVQVRGDCHQRLGGIIGVNLERRLVLPGDDARGVEPDRQRYRSAGGNHALFRLRRQPSAAPCPHGGLGQQARHVALVLGSGIADVDVDANHPPASRGDERLAVGPTRHELGVRGGLGGGELLPAHRQHAAHDRMVHVVAAERRAAHRADREAERHVAARGQPAGDLEAAHETGEREHQASALVHEVRQHVAQRTPIGRRLVADDDHRVVREERGEWRHLDGRIQHVDRRHVRLLGDPLGDVFRRRAHRQNQHVDAGGVRAPPARHRGWTGTGGTLDVGAERRARPLFGMKGHPLRPALDLGPRRGRHRRLGGERTRLDGIARQAEGDGSRGQAHETRRLGGQGGNVRSGRERGSHLEAKVAGTVLDSVTVRSATSSPASATDSSAGVTWATGGGSVVARTTLDSGEPLPRSSRATRAKYHGVENDSPPAVIRSAEPVSWGGGVSTGVRAGEVGGIDGR